MVLNLLRAPFGRAMMAIRDSEISASSLGISVARTKITAFFISACITGLAGGLLAHYVQYLSPEIFGICFHTIIAHDCRCGLGTVHGAFFGAFLVGLLESLISISKDYLPGAIGNQPGLEPGLFGLILVLFIIFEPDGVYGRWLKLRNFFENFLFIDAKPSSGKEHICARTG